MKQQSENYSLLRSLGITPQAVFLFLFGILISGILLGLLVRNSITPNNKSRSISNIYKKNQKLPNDKNLLVYTEKKSKPLNIETAQNKDVNNEKIKVSIKNKIKKSENLPSLYNQNKVLFSKNDVDTPVIALVIDDMGVDILHSQKILNIPEIYTFSFLTYAPNLQEQINNAKSFGAEILLHVPMEAMNNTYDYGPEYLSTSFSQSENVQLLTNMLNRVNGYIGINNHMGSKFTSDRSQLSAIISELKGRGLMFLDSKTTPNSTADSIVHKHPLPYASRDVFIDDSNAPKDIEKSLIHLENIAKKHGYAVAIAHPRENTINALSKWLPTLKDKNLTSVPLSYIVDNFPKK